MSMHALDPEADVSTLSEDAAAGWQDQLEDSTRGDSGYAETVDGGVITWASISGDLDGDRRTEHVAHILYGPYFMYVEVDTPEGSEDEAHAILDALSTVTIKGPAPTGDRAGAPVPADGTWSSYCKTITSAAQEEWQYQFIQGYDSVQWSCPENTDYLGQWVVDRAGTAYTVLVERKADVALTARRSELSVPEKVGDTATTPHGSDIKLLADEPFDAPGGGAGARLDLATTIPDSTTPYLSRVYMFEDAEGGVTEVYVDVDGTAVPDSAWLEPFVATIATPNAS